MERSDKALKHLGKAIREKTDRITKQPLPARFLWLLSRLDTKRTKEVAALRRFWRRRRP